jgi:hypothetical protein
VISFPRSRANGGGTYFAPAAWTGDTLPRKREQFRGCDSYTQLIGYTANRKPGRHRPGAYFQGESMTIRQLALNAVVAVIAVLVLLPFILYWKLMGGANAENAGND